MSLLNKLFKAVSTEVAKPQPQQSDYDRYHANYEKAQKLYGATMRQHIENIENIKTMYSVARDLYGFNSPEMDKVIDLCIMDIGLADDCAKYSNLMGQGRFNYYTFSRLALIHEKRGELDKAINVCNMAIEKGYESDENGAKIQARLARLIKKQRHQSPQIGD